jgi:FkbM family methyltransferase
MIGTHDNLRYLTDDSIFIHHINRGLSEPYPRELAIVKKYLELYPSCNHTCIDVGGHIGTTSLPYSRLFSKIIAFEPNTKSYNFFIDNIKLNNIDNITLYNKGVFNKTTTCNVIQHNSDNSGCFYIQECDTGSIEVVKLDDIIDDADVVDFIKIDTEGSEFQVLEGANHLISLHKPLIQVETNHCSSKYFGYDKEKIYEFMKQHDYTIFDDDGNNPLFMCK